MTLNEFANETDRVVVFLVAVGTPCGVSLPLGHPDMDACDAYGDAEGTVDDGVWTWSGDESLRFYTNSVTKLTAAQDESLWAELVEEYETAV